MISYSIKTNQMLGGTVYPSNKEDGQLVIKTNLNLQDAITCSLKNSRQESGGFIIALQDEPYLVGITLGGNFLSKKKMLKNNGESSCLLLTDVFSSTQDFSPETIASTYPTLSQFVQNTQQ